MNLILTGATGMVGEGVLLECLAHPSVSKVLIINRRSSGLSHAKLTEIVHKDFHNLEPIADKLRGYHGCLFCLGVSSVGLNEQEYTRLTYDLTIQAARVMLEANPNFVFCYISGAGTDSTEKGSSMWARVKGKTENDLKKMPFKQVYNFRPGLIIASAGQRNTLKLYRYFSWLVPIIKFLFPGSVSTMEQLGKAMINAVDKGYEKSTIEISDIKKLSGIPKP